ncbi:hypothetical protein HK098_003082 [Nowakowskiella sp. JEL0407]|nr:hypothetical protein HK098_003082 [Nowakowskiella sp. JEL0407]
MSPIVFGILQFLLFRVLAQNSTSNSTQLISNSTLPSNSSLVLNSTTVFDFYFNSNKFATSTGAPCVIASSASTAKTDCRPILDPGSNINISWSQLFLVTGNSTINARIKSEFLCDNVFKSVESIIQLDQYTDFTPYVVPGAGLIPNSGDVLCKKNLHDLMDFEVCLFQQKNSSRSVSQIIGHFVDYSLEMSCIQTYVKLKIPDSSVSIQTVQGQIKRNDTTLADVFASFFAVLTFGWLIILYYFYRKRANVYRQIRLQMEHEEKSMAYENLQKEMLLNLVNLNFSDVVPRPTSSSSFVSDDFYSRPAQSRINKLGRSGYGWRIFSLLLPWRVINVANSTLTISSDDKLHLLPKIFTIKVTFRIAVQFLLLAAMFLGYLLFVLSPSVYLPGTFGIYWIVGVIMFSLLLLSLDPRTSTYEKGMLKLLRSVGEPKVPEIMFSYNWGIRKHDVRTLAQAMWNSGIGVWIDSLKLTSGDKLELDIRRAAREVNYIVVFLSPNYVRSRNCQIEFEEAKKFPGKLHVHVLEWNSAVRLVLKHLIDDLQVPMCRITGHAKKVELMQSRFAKWFQSTPAEARTPSPAAEEMMLSEIDKFIAKLENQGRGWIELTAVLHNYSKRGGHAWDFGWWLTNTQSGGGIPDTAPCPPNIEKWNLRPFYPFGKFPTVPTWQEIRQMRNGLKIGNVYLSADGRKTDVDGSALPWKFPIFFFAAILPLFDIVFFYLKEKSLHDEATTCASRVELAMKSRNSSVVNEAICNKFYETTLYVGDGDSLSDSAFKYAAVNEAFSRLYPLAVCNATTLMKNPRAIGDLIPCVSDLTTWFASSDRFFPNRIIWVIICIMTILFLLTIITNIEKIVDTTFSIPSPIRPLLAVSSLEKNAAKPIATVKQYLTRKQPPRRMTSISLEDEHATKGQHFEYKGDYKAVQTMDPGTYSNDSENLMVSKTVTIPPIPSIYVRVHGHGIIADNLRIFLKHLGRHLPRRIGCPNVFDIPEGERLPVIENTMVLGQESYAWVNVFVISCVEDMNTFYRLNREEKVDLEVSVVVIDHSPIIERMTYSQLREKEWNLLREGAETTNWIRSVVYIETRTRIEQKKRFDSRFFGMWKKFHEPVRYVEDSPSDELARQVMLSISLRTKNALFKYGEFFLNTLRDSKV